jgi:hypothetical protein
LKVGSLSLFVIYFKEQFHKKNNFKINYHPKGNRFLDKINIRKRIHFFTNKDTNKSYSGPYECGRNI